VPFRLKDVRAEIIKQTFDDLVNNKLPLYVKIHVIEYMFDQCTFLKGILKNIECNVNAIPKAQLLLINLLFDLIIAIVFI
jgi:hypothetical protein